PRLGCGEFQPDAEATESIFGKKHDARLFKASLKLRDHRRIRLIQPALEARDDLSIDTGKICQRVARQVGQRPCGPTLRMRDRHGPSSRFDGQAASRSSPPAFSASARRILALIGRWSEA